MASLGTRSGNLAPLCHSRLRAALSKHLTPLLPSAAHGEYWNKVLISEDDSAQTRGREYAIL